LKFESTAVLYEAVDFSSFPYVGTRGRFKFIFHLSRHGDGVHALCVFALLVSEKVGLTRHFLGKKELFANNLLKVLKRLRSILLIIQSKLKSR
jgi:hypothetical protein